MLCGLHIPRCFAHHCSNRQMKLQMKFLQKSDRLLWRFWRRCSSRFSAGLTLFRQTWRLFCNQFEGLIEDFNYGTLLRLDSRGENSEENTVFGTFARRRGEPDRPLTCTSLLQPPGFSSLLWRWPGTEKAATTPCSRPGGPGARTGPGRLSSGGSWTVCIYCKALGLSVGSIKSLQIEP